VEAVCGYGVCYEFRQEEVNRIDEDFEEQLRGSRRIGKTKCFPLDLESAVTRVSTYKTIGSHAPKKTSGKGDKEGECQASFAQPGRKISTNIECFKCHKKGHIAQNCPENLDATETGTSNAQTGESEAASTTTTTNNHEEGGAAAQFMTQSAVSMQGSATEFRHLRNHVLLDNQSTEDIFCNLNYLQNIRTVPDTLNLYTNGGVLKCNTKGD
jgi:hypothetical protein